MDNSFAPQQPHFAPIRKAFLTDDELEKPIDVVLISVWGKYTLRGEHRKEVIEKSFAFEVEVPKQFNLGHVKLSVNRHIRRVLGGIRAREFHVDDRKPVKPITEHRRRVKDFISDNGLAENEHAKRRYLQAMENRKKEADMMANGQLPSFIDSSQYGQDGSLPVNTDKVYLV